MVTDAVCRILTLNMPQQYTLPLLARAAVWLSPADTCTIFTCPILSTMPGIYSPPSSILRPRAPSSLQPQVKTWKQGEGGRREEGRRRKGRERRKEEGEGGERGRRREERKERRRKDTNITYKVLKITCNNLKAGMTKKVWCHIIVRRPYLSFISKCNSVHPSTSDLDHALAGQGSTHRKWLFSLHHVFTKTQLSHIYLAEHHYLGRCEM